VIAMSTWNPARQINRPQFGHLDDGAVADVTVLRLERGQFGFLDSAGARRDGDRRLQCEMTIKDGAVVWDLNGRAGPDWRKFEYRKRDAR
jgi:dihydroorotase